MLAGTSAAAPGLPNQFFVLDNAAIVNSGKDLIQFQDIQTLKGLGYQGLAFSAGTPERWAHLTEKVIPWLDAEHLKLTAIYHVAVVDRDRYSFDPELKTILPRLKGRGTVIWLAIRSRAYKPSDPAADELVTALVREVADAAGQYGVQVSIYPHAGLLVEKAADTVRIAKKASRKNVGVTLNLCHWLRAEPGASMVGTMKLVLPLLTMVTINGADRDGKQWIQPLDQGDFDVTAFVRALHELNYRGPIGLQAYMVTKTYGVEPYENLRRSMAAWLRISRDIGGADR
jgi:sugar phosphate isomerase/epimerase